MPAEILTPEQMARADALAVEAGLPGTTLMENAGRAAARAIRARFRPCRVVVLCGPGNNGGDGYVVARLLDRAGWPVRVAALAAPATTDARVAAARWRGPVHPLSAELVGGAGLVVDALFGAGLARPIEGRAAALVAAIRAPVVAVDLPSGVSGLTGEVMGTAPRAALTVTFFRLKPGHLLLPGRAMCGEIRCADIGIPDQVLDVIRPKVRLNGPALFGEHVLAPTTNKWSRGSVTIVAGPMPGAARLAAMAARRAGAGHVSVVTDQPQFFAPDPGVVLLSPADRDALLSEPRRRVWLVGPGGGPAAGEALKAAIAAGRDVVADADALRDRVAVLNADIITPHEREFERLFGPVGADRIEAVRNAAVSVNATVLLKGFTTVVADPSGNVAVSANAPTALATAGTGDVLAGVAAAWRARGATPFHAACAAAWLTGDAAARLGPGLIAEDLAAEVGAFAVAKRSLDGAGALPLFSAS
jgi:hydroxyethylthiazole kinase-like uncharacterized protein yjeF